MEMGMNFSDLKIRVILAKSRSGVKNSLTNRVESESPKIISSHRDENESQLKNKKWFQIALL